MKAAHCAALVTGFAITAGWAADINLKAFAAQIPALPANAAAAGTQYPGGKQWSMMPEKPAAMTQFEQNLGTAILQANTTAAAPGAPGAGAMDPAQAQAMGAKLQSMSESERMAYAMQMQQQMMAGMGRPQAAIVSPAEGQALKQLTTEQQAANADQMRFSALRNSNAKFLNDWEQADKVISTGPAAPGENLGEGGGTDFVCSEAERKARLAAYGAHVKLANEQLAKAGGIDQQMRADIDASIARRDRVLALGAQLKNPAMTANVTSARSITVNNAATLLGTRADFNDQAGRRAALWQHLNDNVRKLPTVDCRGGSG